MSVTKTKINLLHSKGCGLSEIHRCVKRRDQNLSLSLSLSVSASALFSAIISLPQTAAVEAASALGVGITVTAKMQRKGEGRVKHERHFYRGRKRRGLWGRSARV